MLLTPLQLSLPALDVRMSHLHSQVGATMHAIAKLLPGPCNMTRLCQGTARPPCPLQCSGEHLPAASPPQALLPWPGKLCPGSAGPACSAAPAARRCGWPRAGAPGERAAQAQGGAPACLQQGQGHGSGAGPSARTCAQPRELPGCCNSLRLRAIAQARHPQYPAAQKAPTPTLQLTLDLGLQDAFPWAPTRS